MEFIDRAEVRIARVGPSHTGWVSHHGFEFLSDSRFCVRKIDRIMVALAHLAAIGADYLGKLRQMFLRFGKHRCLVDIIEAPREFPCQLQMRELILAHRDEIRFIQEDIGGLQDGVAEETVGGEVFLFYLLLFFLVGRIAFEPGDGSHH